MQRSHYHDKSARHAALATGPTLTQTSAPLAKNFHVLARYLGDTRFSVATQNFQLELAAKRAKPSGMSFPDFLSDNFKAWPEIGELARLEQSLKHAGQFEDGAGLASSASDRDGGRSILRLHHRAQLLVFTQNTTSLWSNLVCGEVPPRPYRLDQPQHVVVWPQDQMSRFRILGVDEARDLTAFQKRPSRKSPYFLGWLKAGLVVELLK